MVNLRAHLESIAKEAGDAILAIYRKGSIASQKKSDGSPVTEADLAADSIIQTRLAQSMPYPVISEETYAPKTIIPAEFFLVDPLDGTKEFLNRRDYFTVNIALIRNKMPVSAVVYAPVFDEMYSVESGIVCKNNHKISRSTGRSPPRAVVSLSHPDPELNEFFATRGITQVTKIGSSYKFCMLADGRADLYIRHKPTNEWDTAAGHALCAALGFEILTLPDHSPLCYGKSDLLNPGFLVQRPNAKI